MSHGFGGGAMGGQLGGMGGLSLELEFPQSVAVYDKYADAQRAVDFLSDEKFPVEHLAIVGTDLKLIERVTGRRNWGSVLGTAIINGLTTGLVLGILFSLFAQPGMVWAAIGIAVTLSVFFNVVFGGLRYAMSGGKRDFNSITQTIPARFEILCEHKVAARAKELLNTMPGARAALFE